ncbi:MAG: hypothetical protein GF334_08460 [Candidatus Altiarchaeales archaeon]|nr:hypothetical protein [Candidatus Altiarchaeales archaeon]
MEEQQGFFVQYDSCFYSVPFEKLSEARADARQKSPKKLKIFHGVLKHINDELIDDSGLSLVPRVGGYDK